MCWLGLVRLFLRLWTMTVSSSIIKHLIKVKQADRTEKTGCNIQENVNSIVDMHQTQTYSTLFNCSWPNNPNSLKNINNRCGA